MRHQHPLAQQFPTYESCEEFFTRPRGSLEEYLEMHSVVEQVQRLDTLAYFVSKLVRGAYVFESICYLELRHTPWYRTDPSAGFEERVRQMRDVVRVVAEAGDLKEYPLRMRQILCMHSRLPIEINREILQLAADNRGTVCGVDLAGPDTLYKSRLGELIELFQQAQAAGIPTTGHLFETPNGCVPELLPYLNRIGHGIQIPLHYPELLKQVADRGQCLEVCPTTYLKTGTLHDLSELRTVFERCGEQNVDIVLCTDNAGIHNVRLPFEIENLLVLDVIDFKQLRRCHEAAYRHAFDWPLPGPPEPLLAGAARGDAGALRSAIPIL